MTRAQTALAAVLTFASAGCALADLTITGENRPGASGGTDRYTIYIRNEQMRVDQLQGAEGDVVANSMIIRFSGSPAGTLFLDHEAKTVSILPVDAVARAEQMVSARTDAAENPIEERNETKEVMGHTTEGYDFSFSGTATPPGMDGQQMPPGMADMLELRLDVSGTAWVAPGLDGAEELAAFYSKMAEKQMALGAVSTRASAAGSDESPGERGLSHGLTSIMAEIAENGFPLRTEMTTDVTVDAEGPMAGMLQQMMSGAAGSSTHVSEVTSVSTETVDEDLFYDGGLPEGYTQETIEPPM